MFPTLGETQARYVSPAARPALAGPPHRPLPLAPPLRPSPPPLRTEYSTAAAAAPFPASFLPGRLSAEASAAHTHPHPDSFPRAPCLLPPSELAGAPRSPSKGFRASRTSPGSVAHSSTHAPSPGPRVSHSTLGGSHPHPASPAGLSGLFCPKPLWSARLCPAFSPHAPKPSFCPRPLAHPGGGLEGARSRALRVSLGEGARQQPDLLARTLLCRCPRNSGARAAAWPNARRDPPETPPLGHHWPAGTLHPFLPPAAAFPPRTAPSHPSLGA
ncbi:uncharacterized protein LOC118150619 [Callithrix jacchus]